MKAIIYAGITLLSAASVYGLVDYYNTKSKGGLDKLYQEEEPSVTIKKDVTPVTPPANIEVTKAISNTATVTAKKENKKLKVPVRKIRLEDFSRGRIKPEMVIIDEIKTDSTVVKKENN